MKSTSLLIIGMSIGGCAMAQLPEDALKYSWFGQNGTARNQAVGGAMGSLGGDITATFVNPAGLGLYKTGEFVLSPGFSFMKNKSDFRESKETAKDNSFNFGGSGVVLGFGNRNSSWKSAAFSFAVNRTANFSNNIFYKGLNDFSSFSEAPADEFFEYYKAQKDANINLPDNVIIDNALSDPSVSLLTKMSLYTYLVDIDSTGGQKRVISRAEEAGLLDQQKKIVTSGGSTELAIGFAGNMNDKFYLGGSLGIPIVNYEQFSEYTETDATNNANNNFNSTTYTETFTEKGVGINVKFGLIFKPVESIRLGLAVHTPSYYVLTQNYSASLETDVENLFGPGNGVDKVASSRFGADPEYKYDLVSPWKVLLSGSYVFREVEDVTKQRGFVSADVEYINYGSSSYKSPEESGDDTYYSNVNSAIKEIYKSAFNFRLGGELKFKTVMARGGFSYYGSPYSDKELEAHRMFISGGLGYRDKGFFVDLTYVHGLHKDANFPYRLPNKPNTYAEVKGSGGNILLTVGSKF